MKKKVICLFLSLILLASATLAVYAFERRNSEGYEVWQAYNDEYIVDEIIYSDFIPCSIMQEQYFMPIADFEEALELFMREYFTRRPLGEFEEVLELFLQELGAVVVDDDWYYGDWRDCEHVVYGDSLFYYYPEKFDYYPEKYTETDAFLNALENNLSQFIQEQRRLEIIDFEEDFALFMDERFGMAVNFESYFDTSSSAVCVHCRVPKIPSTMSFTTHGPCATFCARGEFLRILLCTLCGRWHTTERSEWGDLHFWTSTSRSWIEHRVAVHPGNCHSITETWDRCTNRCSSTRNIRRQTSVFWCTSPGLFRQDDYEE